MIGETGAMLLGLLLMEINIIKIKGAEKVCKSLSTYCSTYLPLFWKNAEVYIKKSRHTNVIEITTAEKYHCQSISLLRKHNNSVACYHDYISQSHNPRFNFIHT